MPCRPSRQRPTNFRRNLAGWTCHGAMSPGRGSAASTCPRMASKAITSASSGPVLRLFHPEDDQAGHHSIGGDPYVAAVEFSDPMRAQVLVTYGNASQPDSPHFGDQLTLPAIAEMRPAWRPGRRSRRTWNRATSSDRRSGGRIVRRDLSASLVMKGFPGSGT